MELQINNRKLSESRLVDFLEDCLSDMGVDEDDITAEFVEELGKKLLESLCAEYNDKESQHPGLLHVY